MAEHLLWVGAHGYRRVDFVSGISRMWMLYQMVVHRAGDVILRRVEFEVKFRPGFGKCGIRKLEAERSGPTVQH